MLAKFVIDRLSSRSLLRNFNGNRRPKFWQIGPLNWCFVAVVVVVVVFSCCGFICNLIPGNWIFSGGNPIYLPRTTSNRESAPRRDNLTSERGKPPLWATLRYPLILKKPRETRAGKSTYHFCLRCRKTSGLSHWMKQFQWLLPCWRLTRSSS